MNQIEVRTASHRQMVDITRQVAAAIEGVGDGTCHVYVPHTTAAVVINEHADPDVARDLIAAYEAMVPETVGFGRKLVKRAKDNCFLSRFGDFFILWTYPKNKMRRG